MNTTIAHEVDRIADRLNFLATVASVAPFVGLFGTVWESYGAKFLLFFAIGLHEA